MTGNCKIYVKRAFVLIVKAKGSTYTKELKFQYCGISAIVKS